MTLNGRGTVAVSADRYIGSFNSDGIELCTAKLYLLIYLEIIPLIIQNLQKEIEDDLWSKDKYISFLTTVAADLTERINGKLSSLQQATK